jgi:hypothetical protein
LRGAIAPLKEKVPLSWRGKGVRVMGYLIKFLKHLRGKADFGFDFGILPG